MAKVELINVPFKPGMHLTVIGVIKPDPVRFSINMGHSESDLGMHFNPRFHYSVDRNTIVMNSRKGGWQEEVKDSNFPFHAGQEFKVTITYNSNKFYATLADGTLVKFPNRGGDTEFKYIFCEGDADITSLKLE